jgi:dTDP-4-amino-4,6-dideoxygalactose transaminase
LPYLEQWTEARRRIASEYHAYFSAIEEIQTPQVAANRSHVYHLYVIRTDRRDSLRKHLSDAGISTVLSYPKALPFYPAYAYLGHTPDDYPVAYANQSRILSLPIYPEIKTEMIAYVAANVAMFFEPGSVCRKSLGPSIQFV